MRLPKLVPVPTTCVKDPHRGMEVELMLTRGKRLAHIKEPFTALPDGFVVEQFYFNGITRSLVYRDGDQVFASCLKRAYRLCIEGVISARTANTRCGLLLGYEKAAIRRFMRRGEGLW